jgi:glycosyltransferase involved in cell wall biosynthesis
VRILFLTQILPYPLDAGPKVKTWNVLSYLAGAGHQVTLVSFIRDAERAYLPVLSQVCSAVHPVPIHRSRLADIGYWLRSQVTRRPFLVERDNIAAMRNIVRRLLESERFDVVHADQLTMAQYALLAEGLPDQPRLVFDAHNAVWTVVERMKNTSPVFLKPFLALEASRVRRYEGTLIHRFDHSLAVTETDREALSQVAAEQGGTVDSSRINVIPISVDTASLQPVKRFEGSLNILTLGTLLYPPNADGIRWFAREVFPIIRNELPGASLTIIGKNPPQDFIQLSHQSSGAIDVTGYVPDLAPYLEKAGVMVIPVRAGGGMRVRILEAFSRGIPVVTTTVGLEGIDARVGEDVLVEDTAVGFASATIRLLENPALQGKIANNGRRLAETCYDGQVVLKRLDMIYSRATPEAVSS